MNLPNIKRDTRSAGGDRDAPGAAQGVALNYCRPRYRVEELDAEFRVAVDLPGVPKEAAGISVVEGVLEIEASRRWTERETWSPLAGVAEDGVVYRLRLALGDAIAGDGVAAKLESGVLQLTLEKAEEKKPRRIAVA